MILEIFWLESLISFMDWTISCKLSLAFATKRSASTVRPATARVFSLFRRAKAVISVVDADVSCKLAAWRELLAAKDWLAEATCAEEAAAWFEPSRNSAVISPKAEIGRASCRERV